MIDEQHEERESEGNTDEDKSLIDKNSSSNSPSNDFTVSITRETDSDSRNEPVKDSNVLQEPQNILDPFAANSDVKEIRDIVQTIANLVFLITDSNNDQLANRSSNTLGMRVKDSLILKVQQTQRKEIPFDELKASIACRRIVDDDLQTKFLPCIESLPLSSDGENLSTKPKKSVSLAEEVKVYNRMENESISENDVDFLNELMDLQIDRVMDRQRISENDEKICDLTSRRSSSSFVKSEDFFFDKHGMLGSTEKNTTGNQDEGIRLLETVREDLQKLKSHTSLQDLNERIQMKDVSAHDKVLGFQNSSIVSFSNENEVVVSLANTAADHSTSKVNGNWVSKNDKTGDEEAIKVFEDLKKRDLHDSENQFENVPTELIDLERGIMSEPKMVKEDSDKSVLNAEEEIEQGGRTFSIKEPLISNVEEEKSSEQGAERSEFKRSKISDNSYEDNFNGNSSANDILSTEKDAREECLEKNTKSSAEAIDIAEKIVSKSEDQLREDSKLTQSLKNSKQQSSTNIASLETKLGPGQTDLESNNEVDKIPENGSTASPNFSPEKSHTDGDSFTPEARFNFERSPEFDQKINDREISEENERPESSSGSNKLVDEDGTVADEDVKSLKNNGNKEGTAIDEHTMIEQKQSKPSTIYDQHPAGYHGLKLRGSSEIGLKDAAVILLTCEDSVTDGVERKDSRALSKIESLQQLGELRLSDEALKRKSTFDTKPSSPRSYSSPKKTSSRVSLKTNKSSMKSSRTDCCADQPSTNHPSPEETSSKVLRKANQLSGKLSKNDISELMISGSYNSRLEAETSLVSLTGKNLLDATLHVADTDLKTAENEDSMSFFECEDSNLLNQSEDTLTASVDSNVEESHSRLEPSIDTKKRNKFMEGLKRSLQSRLNRSKKWEEKSETKLKVMLKSQTDMNEEVASKSLTEPEDGDDTEKSTRYSQLLDTEPSQPSAMIIKDCLIGETRKSISEPSKQSKLETPKNVMNVYAVAVDSDPKQNLNLTHKIIHSSSTLDHSQDLSERNSCDIDESDTRAIPRELELIPKSSKDLESEPLQREKSNVSPKINKMLGKLLKKMYSKNSIKESSRKCANNDELPESKDPMNYSKTHEKENANNGEEDISRKSGPSESQRIPESVSRSETDKTTLQKPEPFFIEKPDSVCLAYLVKPSGQDQPEGKIIIDDKAQSDSTVVQNETIEGHSNDSIRQDNQKQSLLSSIKSVFKSLNRPEPQQRSSTSSEDLEKTNITNKSSHSLRTNKLGASVSGIEVEGEESSHSTMENEEISMVESMKSLQDDRKRSKNRRRPGHRLLDDGETPFVTENLVSKSYQATTQSDFIRRHHGEKSEDVEVDGKSKSSEESTAASSLQTLLTGEEDVEEQTARISNRRKKSKTKENPEGSTKWFAISLSRIFSNSSRKRNVVKESKPTANSQTNPEDHFEITKIPLSSSDDSSTQENGCKIIKQKSYATEENGEEVVAIKSLDSTHDLDYRESIEKHPSRVLRTNISNDKPLCSQQSGTFIYSAPIVVNQIFSDSELAEKNSLDNIQEVRKPAVKNFAAKGTIVSYAPMVESAKYIPDELDDRSTDDDQTENHQKSSSGKSFSTIRKLFSRGSIRSREGHATVEDHSVDLEGNKESKKSCKSSIIRHRREKEHSVDQLNEEPKLEATISAIINPGKIFEDDDDENREQKTYHEIQNRTSKSEVNDVECPVVHDEVLFVNNLSETTNIQNHIDDREYDSQPVGVKPNHGGLKPIEPKERVVVDEIVIPLVSQTDSNDTIDVGQELNQRSNHTNKSSTLSMKDEEKRHENSLTLPIEDTKKTSKEQGVAKTESVLSRSLKRLFKKRSSVVDAVASNNYVEDPVDESSRPNMQTLSHPSINDTTDSTVETEPHESGESKTKDEIQFAVYKVNSRTRFPTNCEKSSQRPEERNDRDHLDHLTSKSKSVVSLLETLSKAESQYDKRSIKYKSMNKYTEIESSAALTTSETHIAVSFSTQINSERGTRVNQDEIVGQNQSRSKIASNDFRLNPSFASRRSTVVMMATPIPPRSEPRTEVSNHSNHPRNESSNSPTAFYYLLGPSLDEALVDVRVLFQNLIDKITGRGR